MSVEAACIDITGSSRAMDVAYLDGDSLRLTSVTTITEFQEWIESNKPTTVAIDAPSKENTGQVASFRERHSIPEKKYENFRICEVILKLKGIGLYNTPKDKPPEWMKRGWDLYSLLAKTGYELLDKPGPVETRTTPMMLEVHPHACFVVGLGWRPQTKKALGGQLERAAYLRQECGNLGIRVSGTLLEEDQLQLLSNVSVNWDSVLEYGIQLPVISHDQLDAIVGLMTAVRASRGMAVAVGEPADGVIVLPSELTEAAYTWKHK